MAGCLRPEPSTTSGVAGVEVQRRHPAVAVNRDAIVMHDFAAMAFWPVRSPVSAMTMDSCRSVARVLESQDRIVELPAVHAPRGAGDVAEDAQPWTS